MSHVRIFAEIGLGDLPDVSGKKEILAAVVKKLNNRLRKCLGYKIHAEVFQQAKRGALRK